MKRDERKIARRCAVYTRVSADSGLEQDFNSLDNQREASEAYVKSQAHEGWKLVRERYDDGGFSGGSMERPALQKLLDDVRARKIDVIVVHKVPPENTSASGVRNPSPKHAFIGASAERGGSPAALLHLTWQGNSRLSDAASASP